MIPPMSDHEAALWTAELGPAYAGPVTAPDRRHPLDAPTLATMAALRARLREAIASSGRPAAHVARAAGMDPAFLNRILSEEVKRDGALSSYVRIAAALGLRLALVPAEGPPPAP